MANGIAAMSELQDKLYAQHQWGVLLIFQAMDAAGKDGSIKHVMSGVNPQGVEVYSFKTPSAEELDHDYLWRTSLVFQDEAGLASSIALITKKCWWCGFILSF